jgi:hypothetical protein
LPSTRYDAFGMFQAKLITLGIICYCETSLDLKRKDLPPPPTLTHVDFIMKNNLLISLGFSFFFNLLGLKDVDLILKVFYFSSKILGPLVWR